MRVTSNMSSDTALYNIQQGRSKLDKLQELISSGQNVNRPSDDPIASSLILDIADKVKSGDQYSSNITKATTWQQFTNTALTGMSDTMNLAKKLVNSIYSGTTDTSIQNSTVSQLQAMKQQIIDMGNTQYNDQYLFGGANSGTAPFSGTPSGVPPSYYSGDETMLNIEVGKGSIQPMNIPGNQLLTADTAASQPYGSTNILKTFDDLIAAVQTNNVNGIQAGATALDAGSKQIQNATTEVGSRMTRLDSFSKLNQNTRNTLITALGNTQNVDYAKLGIELTQQQTAFNASLSATAKITQLSLLDYM